MLVRDRAHLDDAAGGPALRDLERLGLVGDLHDGIAANAFLRLGERAVAHHR